MAVLINNFGGTRSLYADPAGPASILHGNLGVISVLTRK